MLGYHFRGCLVDVNYFGVAANWKAHACVGSTGKTCQEHAVAAPYQSWLVTLLAHTILAPEHRSFVAGHTELNRELRVCCGKGCQVSRYEVAVSKKW